MIVMRPIRAGDLDALFELSRHTAFGLTTLPQDRDFLARRIEESRASFERPAGRPQGEAYLFVAEDLATGALAGTSGVVAKVGGFEPFYSYRIETTVHESQALKIRKEVRALHLVMDHNGPCEIGSLFLSPDYRGAGLGRFLSLSRFLFMADFPDRFDPQVVAEMRGVIDDSGRSPFWDALGRHFFELDFAKADYLSMVNKAFIGELMPRHPIYIPLLPKAAQDVIGQVHSQTAPARAILESEGFRFRGFVDIFEAGPLLHCPLTGIGAIQRSVLGRIATISDAPPAGAGPRLLSNARLDFRACIGPALCDEQGRVTIDRVTALTLAIRIGDPVRLTTLKPAG